MTFELKSSDTYFSLTFVRNIMLKTTTSNHSEELTKLKNLENLRGSFKWNINQNNRFWTCTPVWRVR